MKQTEHTLKRMTRQIEFRIGPKSRGCHLITPDVIKNLPELPEAGLLNLFVCHTSCALSINENYDPDVRSDLSRALDRLAPESPALYAHADEGPDDMPAHIKSSLLGPSVTIPIRHGQLALGTWQGVYLCEFRNHGGSRRLIATVIE